MIIFIPKIYSRNSCCLSGIFTCGPLAITRRDINLQKIIDITIIYFCSAERVLFLKVRFGCCGLNELILRSDLQVLWGVVVWSGLRINRDMEGDLAKLRGSRMVYICHFKNCDHTEKMVKGYFLIITCCCTRAVHIALTPDHSIKLFSLAFRRLISRCGIPKH